MLGSLLRVSHVYRGHSCSPAIMGSLGNKFAGVPTTLRNYKRVIETQVDDEVQGVLLHQEPLARLIDMGTYLSSSSSKKDRTAEF